MGEVSIGDRAAAPSRQPMHATNTGAPFQARWGGFIETLIMTANRAKSWNSKRPSAGGLPSPVGFQKAQTVLKDPGELQVADVDPANAGIRPSLISHLCGTTVGSRSVVDRRYVSGAGEQQLADS